MVSCKATDVMSGVVAFLVFLLQCEMAFSSSEKDDTNTYIVVMKADGYRRLSRNSHSSVFGGRESRAHFSVLISSHHDAVILKAINRISRDVKIHSYTDVFSGFSARLKAEEAAKIKEHPDVYAVTRDAFTRTATTRSYEFLGLNRRRSGAWLKSTGTDVIIGVVDTGVWPEDPSFNDDGFGPIPSSFTGVCQSGDNFTISSCNKKLIGARYFGDGYAKSIGVKNVYYLPRTCNEYVSPRDAQGHGSHTSSIAAGSVAMHAAIAGQPTGTAKGVAHGARLSHYKVFWCHAEGDNPPSGGMNSDIIAAIDAAVGDGVHVISGSFGDPPPHPGSIAFDVVAYATYYATISGVACVMAGGNDGPADYTVTNTSPWIYTIGAGTIDRKFVNTIVLGNGDEYMGQALPNSGTPMASKGELFELVDSEKVALSSVRGSVTTKKILLSPLGSSASAATRGSANDSVIVGMIQYSEQEYLHDAVDSSQYLPNVVIGYDDGLAIKEYIASVANPKAYIRKTEIMVGRPVAAPETALFSSRGPNGASLSILKPDIIAPGVSIFAAWSQSRKARGGFSTSPLPDGSPSAWNIISGTSMACPHVAGVVALIKSYHPDWLPSMIFSAISTTAQSRNNNGKRIQSQGFNANPFDIGSGHINPNKAMVPGLVLKMDIVDYNTFICSPESGIYKFPAAVDAFNCTTQTSAVDLNLPSISFYNVTEVTSTTRTFTNVGPATTYYVFVKQPRGASLVVHPTKLNFTSGNRLQFLVKLKPFKSTSRLRKRFISSPSSPDTIQDTISWEFTYIIWYDNLGHRVRIPVALNVQ